MSAQHDLERVIELIEHFKIPAIVCINKFDLNVKPVAVFSPARQQARRYTILVRFVDVPENWTDIIKKNTPINLYENDI